MAASLPLIVVAGWLGGLLVEQFMRPRPLLWRRPLAAHLVHAGLYLTTFCLLLTLLQRPLFSAVLGMALLLIMVLVNNAKYRALREPFVFTDFALYSQAVRHPRLYLPYLGWGAMLAIPLLGVAVFYLGLAYEDSLLENRSGWTLLSVAGAGLLCAAVLIAIGGRLLPAAGENVEDDVRRLGLLASLWLYQRSSLRQPGHGDPMLGQHLSITLSTDAAPHVVAVQSESFFDARRLHPAIRQDILEHYDRVTAQARLHGRLQVPAWGANTMRTEFAFLSGIDSASLGAHRFNPYQTLVHQPVPTLASVLRSRGYRSVCIHPYPSDFFQRSRVYPLLGFDEFIDIADFVDAERVGPYTSDAAVSDKIGEILHAATGPTFVFVITMENHGPLHLETVNETDEQSLYNAPPGVGLENLTVYLRHLRNADRMVAELAGQLKAQQRGGLLCFYGDHVPGMPTVFDQLGYRDDGTDYFIWSSQHSGSGRVLDSKAHELAAAILEILADDAGRPDATAAGPGA